MIDTDRDGIGLIYGTSTLVHDGKTYTLVATALEVGRNRLRLQPPFTEEHAYSVDLTSKVEISDLALYTPFGTYKCREAIAGEVTSILGGGMNVEDSPIWRLIGHVKIWAEIVVRLPGELVLDAPFDADETYFVGRSLDAPFPVELGDGRQFISRRASTSLLGRSSVPVQVDRTAASVASGTSLRLLGIHRATTLTIYNNAIADGVGESNPLFYAGYPFLDQDQICEGAAKCFNLTSSRLQSCGERAGEHARQAIDGYLEGRGVKAFAELKLLAAFHFMEFLCESRTLSKRPLSEALAISLEEANGLILFRNAHLHNREVAGITASELVRKLEDLRSEVFLELRHDTKRFPVLGIMNYVFTLCDRALLRWIGFQGKHKQYISHMALVSKL